MARITLLGPFWPYRGGIAHFGAGLARSLAARGHDVRTVTFQRQYPDRLFPGATQFEPGPAPPGVPRAPAELDTLNVGTWTRAADRIADEGGEVAVIPYWTPLLAPMWGVVTRRLRRRGVTVLALVHNAIPHERRPGDLLLGRFALGGADGLLALSDRVAADVQRLGVTAPVHTVPHPVYDGFGAAPPRVEARQELGLPARAPVFLFFGFVRPYKGLHVLLDAWGGVVQRVPGARLVVAGEFYADENALRAQAAPFGASVRFDAGYIPDSRVGLYFSAASAVVQPYVTATQSGVAQIAFHYGRPVITSDVGGLAEAVPDGEAGLVVPPDDPAALAAALVRFVEEGLGGTFEAGVRRVRDAASWGRVAEAVEHLAGTTPPRLE
ncbi:glycosyltransferase [Rubrivirga sp. S365]|uniref:glycosyltransferase n=1 Tax=Rubrivirga sp. S365 TaxID=3076080 RepID=UPI0028C5AEA0|nr:glycosyltransferase [Rubrivirga sp. S365]MDT7855703.1 glycosyltransferase [Rubrivirga sp. S365]